MKFGASEPIYQTRKCSLLVVVGGGGGGGGSYYDGDICVCMHACLYPQADHNYFVCFYARMHLQKARVQISRCLSATEEPGERHDWRIGTRMPSPACGQDHTTMVIFTYACMHTYTHRPIITIIISQALGL